MTPSLSKIYLEPTLVTGSAALVLRAVDTRIKLVQQARAVGTRSRLAGRLTCIVAATTSGSATKGSLTGHARLSADIHGVTHTCVAGAGVVGWRSVAAQAAVTGFSIVGGVATGGWGVACASCVGRGVATQLTRGGLAASGGTSVICSRLA